MRKGSKNFCSLLKINFPKQREPRNASRNQQTKTGINQEQEAMHDLRLILKKKKTKKKKEVPSNASSNNSTITFMLELGQDLLGHQSGCVETNGLI
jgi:hypothetical protein